MRLSTKLFGTYKNTEILEYTLTNSDGVSLSVISYGGIITKIEMPDHNGKIENITVNFDTLEEIVASRPFHGAVIGRVSGRIGKGTYMDNGEEIKLDRNEGVNTLHGGYSGLDQKVWDVKPLEGDDYISLILTTTSLDGEAGFPGDLEVTVTYTLNEQSEITLQYQATTNRRTLFNPTNHVYFNLSGHANQPIYDHEFQLKSDHFAVLDAENIPTGELQSVEGTAFDLRTPSRLKSVIQSDERQISERGGLDHPFVLNQAKDTSSAMLKHQKSGRTLEVKTDCDAVVVYTHNTEKVPVTRNEETLPAHSGIALETCSLPDAVNHENFGSIFLDPDEDYSSTTVFRLAIQ